MRITLDHLVGRSLVLQLGADSPAAFDSDSDTAPDHVDLIDVVAPLILRCLGGPALRRHDPLVGDRAAARCSLCVAAGGSAAILDAGSGDPSPRTPASVAGEVIGKAQALEPRGRGFVAALNAFASTNPAGGPGASPAPGEDAASTDQRASGNEAEAG